jgi:ring-1,2-phenylacetyl-CoA epoxidase subunit PaaC
VSDDFVDLVTALADDELVIGHRHSEWTGFAPHLEEDVAFSSIAQDEIGHAAAYFELLSRETGLSPDQIALGREPAEYRSAVLCERANRDWAYTLARHWLYDHADEVRLRVLESSAHEGLAALAVKIRREERYHLIHADTWMKLVVHGPVEGRTRLTDALAEAFDEAMGLFEPLEREAEAVGNGWLPEPSRVLLERFAQQVGRDLDSLGLPTKVRRGLDESAEFIASSSGDLIADGDSPRGAPGSTHGVGGRKGRHTTDFEQLWSDLTATFRASPGASW